MFTFYAEFDNGPNGMDLQNFILENIKQIYKAPRRSNYNFTFQQIQGTRQPALQCG